MESREWTGKIKRRDAHRGITAHPKWWIHKRDRDGT